MGGDVLARAQERLPYVDWSALAAAQRPTPYPQSPLAALAPTMAVMASWRRGMSEEAQADLDRNLRIAQMIPDEDARATAIQAALAAARERAQKSGLPKRTVERMTSSMTVPTGEPVAASDDPSAKKMIDQFVETLPKEIQEEYRAKLYATPLTKYGTTVTLKPIRDMIRGIQARGIERGIERAAERTYTIPDPATGKPVAVTQEQYLAHMEKYGDRQFDLSMQNLASQVTEWKKAGVPDDEIDRRVAAAVQANPYLSRYAGQVESVLKQKGLDLADTAALRSVQTEGAKLQLEEAKARWESVKKDPEYFSRQIEMEKLRFKTAQTAQERAEIALKIERLQLGSMMDPERVQAAMKSIQERAARMQAGQATPADTKGLLYDLLIVGMGTGQYGMVVQALKDLAAVDPAGGISPGLRWVAESQTPDVLARLASGKDEAGKQLTFSQAKELLLRLRGGLAGGSQEPGMLDFYRRVVLGDQAAMQAWFSVPANMALTQNLLLSWSQTISQFGGDLAKEKDLRELVASDAGTVYYALLRIYNQLDPRDPRRAIIEAQVGRARDILTVLSGSKEETRWVNLFWKGASQEIGEKVIVDWARQRLGRPPRSSEQPRPQLDPRLAALGSEFRVTSTTGDTHAPGSLHYQGKAIDIVPPGPPSTWDAVILDLRRRGFRVIDERKKGSKEWTGPHLHIEAP